MEVTTVSQVLHYYHYLVTVKVTKVTSINRTISAEEAADEMEVTAIAFSVTLMAMPINIQQQIINLL